MGNIACAILFTMLYLYINLYSHTKENTNPTSCNGKKNCPLKCYYCHLNYCQIATISYPLRNISILCIILSTSSSENLFKSIKPEL